MQAKIIDFQKYKQKKDDFKLGGNVVRCPVCDERMVFHVGEGWKCPTCGGETV